VTVGSISPTSPFLDLPDGFEARDTAAVCILPVPYDATSSYQSGARFGPAALIAASHQVELYDEQLRRETYRIGLHTCPSVRPNAAGPLEMVSDVRQACEPLLEAGKFIALIGGEHTVTLGAVGALRQKRGRRAFGVVQFDAHRDLRTAYDSTPWSHACVAARLLDWKLPLIQLGVRAWSREEEELAASAGVATFTARDLVVGDRAKEFAHALEALPEEVYLTFDLDVLDPSIMPSTGTPEPGGLSWYQTLALLEELTRRKKVIALDLVELAPLAGLVAPDLLAARLLYRTLGLIARDWPTLPREL